MHWPLRWAPPDPLQQHRPPDNLTHSIKPAFRFHFRFRGSRRTVLIEFYSDSERRERWIV